MHHNHITIPRLLSGIFLLLTTLSACENKQELDTRMDEISGNYQLSSFLIGGTNQLRSLPLLERDAASSARVYANGKDWIFEYTLPIPNSVSGGNAPFSYHRIRQRILWDRQFGEYFFYRLEKEDLSGTGLEPSTVRMSVQNNYIIFSSEPDHLSWEWVKVR